MGGIYLLLKDVDRGKSLHRETPKGGTETGGL